MPEMDMRRMQEEAARRAREMQSRARRVSPQNQQGQQNQPHQQSQQNQHQQSQPPPAPAQAPVSVPVSGAGSGPGKALEGPAPAGLLEELFKDRERTMLLALLILLGGEEGNHELMFALLFLLMS